MPLSISGISAPNCGAGMAPAERIAALITFIAVTLAWVPFRSDTLADAGTMLTYLWPTTADPQGLSSFWGLLQGQFLDFRAVLRVTEWFRPREFWPPTLPPDYLATATRPMGLLLLCVGIATFTVPNTYQIFGRFQPALGLPEDTLGSGVLTRLDWRVAFVIAGMFLLSVLRLSHVSPFLYYQF